MAMIVELIPVGTPTVNGRVYSRAVVDEMMERAAGRIAEKSLFCYEWDGEYANESFTPTDNAYATVDRLFVENDMLMVELTPLRPFSAGVCRKFTIGATGKVNEADVTQKLAFVSDVVLERVLALTKP